MAHNRATRCLGVWRGSKNGTNIMKWFLDAIKNSKDEDHFFNPTTEAGLAKKNKNPNLVLCGCFIMLFILALLYARPTPA